MCISNISMIGSAGDNCINDEPVMSSIFIQSA